MCNLCIQKDGDGFLSQVASDRTAGNSLKLHQAGLGSLLGKLSSLKVLSGMGTGWHGKCLSHHP